MLVTMSDIESLSDLSSLSESEKGQSPPSLPKESSTRVARQSRRVTIELKPRIRLKTREASLQPESEVSTPEEPTPADVTETPIDDAASESGGQSDEPSPYEPVLADNPDIAVSVPS